MSASTISPHIDSSCHSRNTLTAGGGVVAGAAAAGASGCSSSAADIDSVVKVSKKIIQPPFK